MWTSTPRILQPAYWLGNSASWNPHLELKDTNVEQYWAKLLSLLFLAPDVLDLQFSAFSANLVKSLLEILKTVIAKHLITPGLGILNYNNKNIYNAILNEE